MNLAFVGDIEFIRKLTEITLTNLENEAFSGKELSRETAISVTILNKRLQFILHKTVNQFIREVRLQQAMKMLHQETVTAAEVAFKVGFGSPAYFNTCFSEFFGITPGEVKKRGVTMENGNGVCAETESINPEPVQTIAISRIDKKQVWRAVLLAIPTIFAIIILFYFFINSHFDSVKTIEKGRSGNQKKSIAVLPFINDSNDPENVYFINGVMEAILDNLCKIKDLEVHPRTSVEQYRNTTKTIREIGHELGVNYIIEGAGQKIGDEISLSIQLIEVESEKHLFSERYNKKLEDIFNLQSKVAIKVAAEIKAAITPEEKKSIEKAPTTNLAALNLFFQANDLHNIADAGNNSELDNKAELLYKKAIQLDSTFANLYVSLGWIVSGRDLDSAFYLADKALHFDKNNYEACTLKGFVYYKKGMEKKAEDEYLQSLRYNPNSSLTYRLLGELYFWDGECSKAIENQLKVFHLENDPMQERNNLKSLCLNLYSLGFYAEGTKYADKLFQLTGDSTYYYLGLQSADLDRGNFESALESALKMYTLDTTYVENIWNLGYTNLYLLNFKEAFRLIKKYSEIMEKQGRKIEPSYLIGWIYFENGRKEEADFHFEGSIKEMRRIIELNQPSPSCIAYLNLTKIYAVRNEKEKALENLQKAQSLMKYTVFRIKDFKNCTMLDNIRKEPEFSDFLKEAEAKYQIERAKVEKLLLAEGILETSGK